MSDMKKYLGVKMIAAVPAVRINGINYTKSEAKPRSMKQEDGYRVVYDDGYTSWSPKETFEKAYRLIDSMTFGLALEALKQGKKVCRAGWNGKGMYVEYNGDMFLGKKEVKEFLLIKTVNGTFNTWVPSISDLFAEDWMVIEND